MPVKVNQLQKISLESNNKDNIIGIIHAKDLLKAQRYSTKEFKELDITKIASKPWFIPESTPLKAQLYEFRLFGLFSFWGSQMVAGAQKLRGSCTARTCSS